MRFNVSITNKFQILTITIKKISNDFEFYMIEIIRIFVVKTSMIVDDISTKKQTIKFKNIEFYHDKIVKEHLNYVRNINTTFKTMFENFQTQKQKIVYAMQFLKNEIKNA